MSFRSPRSGDNSGSGCRQTAAVSKDAASDTEPTVFPGIILFLTYWFPAEYRARMVGRFMAAIPISTVIGAPIRADPWHGRDLGAQGLAMAVSLRRPADGSAVLS